MRGAIRDMLEDVLHDIYDKLRLTVLTQAYEAEGDRELALTSVETFSMETISALDRPTVAQFARAMHISAPNAAYRVASLVKKGYLRKVRSRKDARIYYLEPTSRYRKYVGSNESFIEDIADRIRERFSAADYDRLSEMLEIIDKELIPGAEIIVKGGNADGSDKGI